MIWNPWATSIHAWALFAVFAGVIYGLPLEKGEKVRPYQFGFTIEEQQHRFEKRDERGIVMGEFGFITADGIYHVTVYATDEEGKFRILAMRNYPYESPPKTIEMIVKPKAKPVIITPTTTTTTQRAIVGKKPLPKYNFNTKACSGCFLKNGIEKNSPEEDSNLALRPVLQPPTLTNTITGIVNEMIKMVSAQKVLSATKTTTRKPFVMISTQTTTTTRKPFVISTQTTTRATATTIPATNSFRTAKMLTLDHIATRTNIPNIPKFTQQTLATETKTNNNIVGTPNKTFTKQPLTNPILGKSAVSTSLGKSVASSLANTPTAPKALSTPTTIASELPPEVDIRIAGKAIAQQKPLSDAKNPATTVPSGRTPVKDSAILGGAQRSGTQNAASGNDSPSSPSSPSGPNGPNSPSSKSSPTAKGDNGDLYHFKYLLDYNGHEETGARNGNKVGNFFSIGDDNVERTIEYIANEFGYQPRIRWRKLDAARTKPAENALKDYEFVWFRKD